MNFRKDISVWIFLVLLFHLSFCQISKLGLPLKKCSICSGVRDR